MVGKYRKKPVVIEAIQYTKDNIHDILAFVGNDKMYYNPKDNEFYIRTLEGDHRLSVNDWVIKGIKGEFYPCKPDVFEKTYEPV